MLITSNSLPVIRRQDLELEDLEILWVEITLLNKSLLLGAFYRPPSSKNNLRELQSTLNGISSHQVILCGDFNMPDIDWSTLSCMLSHLPSQSLCETVKNCALDQLVTEPTRSKNILDLVLTTNPSLIKDV